MLSSGDWIRSSSATQMNLDVVLQDFTPTSMAEPQTLSMISLEIGKSRSEQQQSLKMSKRVAFQGGLAPTDEEQKRSK